MIDDHPSSSSPTVVSSCKTNMFWILRSLATLIIEQVATERSCIYCRLVDQWQSQLSPSLWLIGFIHTYACCCFCVCVMKICVMKNCDQAMVWIIPSSPSPRWWSWTGRSPRSSPRATCPSWVSPFRKLPKFSAKTVKPRCIWVWNFRETQRIMDHHGPCGKKCYGYNWECTFLRWKKTHTRHFHATKAQGWGKLATGSDENVLGPQNMAIWGWKLTGFHPVHRWTHPIGPLAHWPGIAGIEDGFWWVLPPQKAWHGSVMTRWSDHYRIHYCDQPTPSGICCCAAWDPGGSHSCCACTQRLAWGQGLQW